jgi:hypothetical protein
MVDLSGSGEQWEQWPERTMQHLRREPNHLEVPSIGDRLREAIGPRTPRHGPR